MAKLKTGTTIGGNAVWHSGNDGASSGLDADLLDGQHGNYYTNYTDTAISNLIDSAPGTLDTLYELAAALGDDPNFATTVTNNIATKVSKTGDTMTGDLKTTNIQLSSTTPTIWFNGTADGGDGASSDMAIKATPEGLDFFEPEDASKIHFQILDDAGVNAPYGYKVGTTQVIDSSGNVKKSPTLTLSGDASGSATFTDLGDVTLSVTVANDSHVHSSITSIVDRDMKPNTSGFAGLRRIGAFFSSKEGMTGTAGTDYHDVLVLDTYSNASGGGPNAITFDKGNAAGNPEAYLWKGDYNGTTWGTGQRIFADNYHPNADKWTTARTLSLSGDASGSVSWDGSANATLTLTIVDDSHNHIISNVDGLQTALDGKFDKTGGNITGDVITSGQFRIDGGQPFWENKPNITSDYTITSGYNAMSCGPITVDSGVTVTVGSGQVWTVV